MAIDPKSTGAASTEADARRDEVARRAYELWEQEGRPSGASERHWIEAERQVLGLAGSNGAAQASPEESGNPAYPSLEARDRLIDQNARHPVRIHPIPGRVSR